MSATSHSKLKHQLSALENKGIVTAEELRTIDAEIIDFGVTLEEDNTVPPVHSSSPMLDHNQTTRKNSSMAIQTSTSKLTYEIDRTSYKSQNKTCDSNMIGITDENKLPSSKHNAKRTSKTKTAKNKCVSKDNDNILIEKKRTALNKSSIKNRSGANTAFDSKCKRNNVEIITKHTTEQENTELSFENSDKISEIIDIDRLNDETSNTMNTSRTGYLKSIGSRNKKSQCEITKEFETEIKKALSRKNTEKIDLKKNKGLIGMKIKMLYTYETCNEKQKMDIPNINEKKITLKKRACRVYSLDNDDTVVNASAVTEKRKVKSTQFLISQSNNISVISTSNNTAKYSSEVNSVVIAPTTSELEIPQNRTKTPDLAKQCNALEPPIVTKNDRNTHIPVTLAPQPKVHKVQLMTSQLNNSSLISINNNNANYSDAIAPTTSELEIPHNDVTVGNVSAVTKQYEVKSTQFMTSQSNNNSSLISTSNKNANYSAQLNSVVIAPTTSKLEIPQNGTKTADLSKQKNAHIPVSIAPQPPQRNIYSSSNAYRPQNSSCYNNYQHIFIGSKPGSVLIRPTLRNPTSNTQNCRFPLLVKSLTSSVPAPRSRFKISNSLPVNLDTRNSQSTNCVNSFTLTGRRTSNDTNMLQISRNKTGDMLPSIDNNYLPIVPNKSSINNNVYPPLFTIIPSKNNSHLPMNINTSFMNNNNSQINKSPIVKNNRPVNNNHPYKNSNNRHINNNQSVKNVRNPPRGYYQHNQSMNANISSSQFNSHSSLNNIPSMNHNYSTANEITSPINRNHAPMATNKNNNLLPMQLTHSNPPKNLNVAYLVNPITSTISNTSMAMTIQPRMIGNIAPIINPHVDTNTITVNSNRNIAYPAHSQNSTNSNFIPVNENVQFKNINVSSVNTNTTIVSNNHPPKNTHIANLETLNNSIMGNSQPLMISNVQSEYNNISPINTNKLAKTMNYSYNKGNMSNINHNLPLQTTNISKQTKKNALYNKPPMRRNTIDSIVVQDSSSKVSINSTNTSNITENHIVKVNKNTMDNKCDKIPDNSTNDPATLCAKNTHRDANADLSNTLTDSIVLNANNNDNTFPNDPAKDGDANITCNLETNNQIHGILRADDGFSPIASSTPQKNIRNTSLCSVIGKNKDGLVMKINNPMKKHMNLSSDIPTDAEVGSITEIIKQEPIESNTSLCDKNKSKNETPVSSKKEMLKELEEATLDVSPVKSDETPLPVKKKMVRRFSEGYSRPGPKSKKMKWWYESRLDETPGYSPPILPIPTNETIMSKAILLKKQESVDNYKVLIEKPLSDVNFINKTINVKESNKDKAYKKIISLEEYKKRTMNKNASARVDNN